MPSVLSIMVPIPVTDAILISCSVPENDYPTYVPTNTYAVAERCIKAHRIYESAKAGNVGHDPSNPNNRIGTTIWWIDIGPTNLAAMFDSDTSTQTSYASPISMTLRPGAFNAFYTSGLDADTVSLTVKDAPGGATVFSASRTLEGSAPDDYYEHFFSPFKPQIDYLIGSIPEYSAAEIAITFTKASGNVKIGLVSVGDMRPLGLTQRGAKATPKTFSYITVKEGVSKINRRRAAVDMSATAILDLSEANSVLEVLTSVLDVPCLCLCSEESQYQGLRTFGLINGEITYDNPTQCQLSVSVQGLIGAT